MRGVVVFDECGCTLRLRRCAHIRHHDAVVSKVLRVNDCAPNALAGVDTAEKKCTDASLPQDGVELRLEKPR